MLCAFASFFYLCDSGLMQYLQSAATFVYICLNTGNV